MARAFHVARLWIVFFLTFCSLTTFGFGIVLSTSVGKVSEYYGYDIPGTSFNLEVWWSSQPATRMIIAVSGLTLISTIPSFFISLVGTSNFQKFLSVVWIELGWTTVLMVLWLVSVINVTVNSPFPLFNPATEIVESTLTCTFGCVAAKILASVSLVIVVLLGGYIIALTACACVTARKRSQRFLTMPVDDILTPDKPLPPTPLDKGFESTGYPMLNYPSHPVMPSLPYAGMSTYYPPPPVATWNPSPSIVPAPAPTSQPISVVASPPSEAAGMASPGISYMPTVPGNPVVSLPHGVGWGSFAPGPIPTSQPNFVMASAPTFAAAGSTLPNNVTYMLVPVSIPPGNMISPPPPTAGSTSPNHPSYIVPAPASPETVSLQPPAATTSPDHL